MAGSITISERSSSSAVTISCAAVPSCGPENAIPIPMQQSRAGAPRRRRPTAAPAPAAAPAARDGPARRTTCAAAGSWRSWRAPAPRGTPPTRSAPIHCRRGRRSMTTAPIVRTATATWWNFHHHAARGDGRPRAARGGRSRGERSACEQLARPRHTARPDRREAGADDRVEAGRFDRPRQRRIVREQALEQRGGIAAAEGMRRRSPARRP